MSNDAVYFTSAHGQDGVPKRAHSTDAGYDVTVFNVEKKVTASVTRYGTGLRLRPHQKDIYFELVARSSLHKKGYMLVNNVGIIDNDYRGEVLVALYKFDKEAPDLELPARVAQLIPKQMVPVTFMDGDVGGPARKRPHLEEKRGAGGFGSTDK